MPISNTRVTHCLAAARERQRHAPVVVERGRPTHGSAPAPTAHSAASPWSPVLPTLPVTATTVPAERARAATAESRRARRAHPARRAAARRRRIWRDGCRRPRRARRRASSAAATKSWPSHIALDGDEHLARPRRCGCRSRRPDAVAAARRPAPRARSPPDIGSQGPQWFAHDAASASAGAQRRRGSSNGSVLSPTIWPVSWPLPATTSTSPVSSMATAARMASARSPISSRRGAAARIAARIVAGSSLRGLSSVTMTTSASLVGDLAHQWALAGVAIAAAAEHHHQPPAHEWAQRRERRLQRVGLVRVIDETGAPRFDRPGRDGHGRLRDARVRR